MYKEVKQLVDAAHNIVIIQAENPDGDSLGSALALEAIFSDMDKNVFLYCPVEIPKYLRYTKGWDRVVSDFPKGFDLSVIVDTASATLLDRALVPANLAQLKAKPSLVLNHHMTESDLPFTPTMVNDVAAVATGELIYLIAKELAWPLPADANENLAIAILADSLGLSTEGTTARSVYTLAALVEGGANLNNIDARRREFMKKAPEILEYKGRLLQRIEYFLEGSLALVHIPWDEIQAYSDQYNPSVLVLDEMRLVEGVRLAVAIKTYPDGKITGKLRGNDPVAETVAGYFGGGGHKYAAGFRVHGETLNTIKTELLTTTSKALEEYDKTITTTEPC